MTMQEINKLMAEAAEQARKNTEANRENWKRELEEASKKSPRQLMRDFADSI
jgi:hypothetical protein